MESINELELRQLILKKPTAQQFANEVVRRIFEPAREWEEKRSLWHILFLTGRYGLIANALVQALKNRDRVPFDILITVMARAKVTPPAIVIEALLKGLRKQEALDELINARGWDGFDARFREFRETVLQQKVTEQRRFRDSLKEKFEFLINQRMQEQAARVLRRMLELYPHDVEFQRLKAQFEEQWARDVLSTHRASSWAGKHESTQTQPSAADDEMLDCFLKEGEKICLDKREFAADLATAFLFMEDHNRALEAMAWASPNAANEWMRAEMLMRARRFIEALEALSQLELRYINDPETTFAVSYLRAQCLHASGQVDEALDMLKSIVRVRPNYRSAQALILQWSQGDNWE